MARCVRDGATFKRHTFQNGKCKFCGGAEKPKNRRKKRSL